MHIGSKVTSLLGERGWSMAELARRVGVTRAAIWNVCQGHDPSLSLLRRIASELGVSESDLIDGTSTPDTAANG